MSMLSVRFTPQMIAWIRHFARKDGVTASQWLRKLVERELRIQQRPGVDVRLYPMPVTVSSGGDVKVTYIGPGPRTPNSGYWP